MADLHDKLKNTKDKVVGEVKEGTGKATGNEQLELEGKIQSTKSDVKRKGGEIKEGMARNINDTVDRK